THSTARSRARNGARATSAAHWGRGRSANASPRWSWRWRARANGRLCGVESRGELGLLPPPLAGEGWGGGGGAHAMRCAGRIDLVACPLPIPPAEVGYIRLRPIKTGRTRVNPSSAASGGGNAPNMRRWLL